MIQMKADVYLFSKLNEKTVKSAHLHPVKNLTALVSELANQYGPDCRICILPEGPHTIPYIAGDAESPKGW